MKAEEHWQARFRAPRMTLPVWARQAPNQAIYRCNVTGTWEIYAWDRITGASRQVTARPDGTEHCALDPTGQWIWWFAGSRCGTSGQWMRQSFTGGPDQPIDVEPGLPAGIAISAIGLAAVGVACPGEGFRIHLVRGRKATRVLYEHSEPAAVAAMSLDGSLIAISHSEYGDPRHPALRVLRQDGSTLGELYDGPGKGVIGLGFAPVLGDTRLLVLHERRGRHEPMLWNPRTGEEREIWLRDPGETTADWYVDGRAILIIRSDRGRTKLHRYDLAGGGMTLIETPRGVIEAAAPRPDGSVEYAWSSAAHPPVIRSSRGHVVMSPAGPAAPPSVPVEDLDVEGPGGLIHALLSRPHRGVGPFPTVFLLHDGPAEQDDDSFTPAVAAWVDLGFAVVRVNYRGSAGYGSAWRNALHGDVGHIELADVSAVREFVVNRGIADPKRLVVAGRSWGGYLALLALGTQPTVWAAGIADAPIADLAAAYQEEHETLRAAYRALLGGSPEELPDRYAACSPITYADEVTAPLLIFVAENDPRSPIGQLERYIARLTERGHPPEVHRYDTRRFSLAIAERITQMATQLRFARKHTRRAPYPFPASSSSLFSSTPYPPF